MWLEPCRRPMGLGHAGLVERMTLYATLCTRKLILSNITRRAGCVCGKRTAWRGRLGV